MSGELLLSGAGHDKDGVSSRISFRCVCRAHHSFLHVFDPSLVKTGDSNMTDPVFALDAIVRLSPQYLLYLVLLARTTSA